MHLHTHVHTHTYHDARLAVLDMDKVDVGGLQMPNGNTNIKANPFTVT